MATVFQRSPATVRHERVQSRSRPVSLPDPQTRAGSSLSHEVVTPAGACLADNAAIVHYKPDRRRSRSVRITTETSLRLVSFAHEGRDSFGAVVGEHLIGCPPRLQQKYPDLRSLLADDVGHWGEELQAGARLDLAAVRFRPVIPNPAKIICVGLNYRAHLAETGRATGARPVLFLRLPSSQVGHLEPLVVPKESEQLDFEGELAVVIGLPGRRIRAERALDHVAGYSIYNDASIRDWQQHSHQYTAGKNFPGTGAFGPWLVTADEIADPRELELTTRLNGQLMQQAAVADMIFPIEELIAYVSTMTELVPGDVLVTGTPSGVGGRRTPPVWMRPGDSIEVAISRIGVLRNYIAAEKALAGRAEEVRAS